MKNIKHSKFKNTGFIFELLVRQITSEIMSGNTNSKAEKILKEFKTLSNTINATEQELEKILKNKVKDFKKILEG